MDYRVRFEIEIRTIQLANQYYQLFSTFASSWKAVTKSFNDDPYFGKKINYLSLYLNSLADSIKSISSNDEEILRNGYEAIKQIKWNGQEAVSYTHLRAHETVLDLVCRLLLEKKKNKNTNTVNLKHHALSTPR